MGGVWFACWWNHRTRAVRNTNKGEGLSSTDDWTVNNALFKTEGKKYVDLGKFKDIQVNIGLGKGKALNTFNERILNFQEIK